MLESVCFLQYNSDISPAAPLPFNYCEDDGSYVFDDDQKPFLGTRETYESNLVDGESCFDVLDIPKSFEGDGKLVKEGQFVESGENVFGDSFLIDTPFVPANELPVLDDGLFIENDDLLNQMESNPSSFDMLDEYLKYFESADNNSQYSLPDNATLTDPASQVVADDLLPTSKVIFCFQIVIGLLTLSASGSVNVLNI